MVGGRRHLLTMSLKVVEGVPTFPAGITLGGYNSGNFANEAGRDLTLIKTY